MFGLDVGLAAIYGIGYGYWSDGAARISEFMLMKLVYDRLCCTRYIQSAIFIKPNVVEKELLFINKVECLFTFCLR